MSRNSQPQLSGHEEAARFDRENRIPQNPSLYFQRRSERYPDTPRNELPREALPSKEVYKDRQRENTRATDRYKSTRLREEQIVGGYEEDQRQYYKAHSGGIRPSGHRDLEPLAGRLADAELRHARAREDTMTQHPFMDTSLGSKREHHQHVRNHFNNVDGAREDQRWHARLRAAVPPTRTRDLYGQEPRRSSEPYHEPYPPYFPPEGRYSTTLGSDASSSGAGWTDVASSSTRKGRGR